MPPITLVSEDILARYTALDAKLTSSTRKWVKQWEADIPLLAEMQTLLGQRSSMRVQDMPESWTSWFNSFVEGTGFPLSLRQVQRKIAMLRGDAPATPAEEPKELPEERLLAEAREQFGAAAAAGNEQAIAIIADYAQRLADAEDTEEAKQNINVVAVEMTRRLQSVATRRNEMNPSVRTNLIAAMRTTLELLEADFQQPVATGKCHQRLVREHMATLPDPDLEAKMAVSADFSLASVREISYEEAQTVILSNEYLGTMGSVSHSYGLYFGQFLGGCVCLGSTAGTGTSMLCGDTHQDKVTTIVRGACLPWTPVNSATYLDAKACKQMAKYGKHIFISYSDPAGGEVGTIYSAINHLYCGMTTPTERYRWHGRVYDGRQVSGMARDRTGGTLKMRRSRAQQKALLIEQGAEFFLGNAKHRWVGFYGSPGLKKTLRAALTWDVETALPKRESQQETLAA
jgi:hypothetical protein